MIVLLDVPFGTFETFSVTFSLLIVLKSFFLGKSGIASDRVGDLPRQPSSLTFFSPQICCISCHLTLTRGVLMVG